MDRVQLAIVYTPEGGKPYRVVGIEDRALLRDAAAAAVREAEQRAYVLDGRDPFLSAVETAEASRLRRVLGMIVPEFNGVAREEVTAVAM
jgi:hypothetical protein